MMLKVELYLLTAQLIGVSAPFFLVLMWCDVSMCSLFRLLRYALKNNHAIIWEFSSNVGPPPSVPKSPGYPGIWGKSPG